MEFTHDTPAQRVLFGTGRAQEFLHAELRRLTASSVMVIAPDREVSRARRLLASHPVAVWCTDVAQHVPTGSVANVGAQAETAQVDTIVTIGGGSAVGLAKAVALESHAVIIALPTTYAGSEATDVWGFTAGGAKTTGTDPRVLPVSVIYDAELSRDLPAELSFSSGLNGLAHCIDALWAPGANPINRLFAFEGVRAFTRALPAIHTDPTSTEGRERALYATYLAGRAFSSAGSGLHHKICHVLGGRFNLPHARTHTVVLPHVLAFNEPYGRDAVAGLADALGSPGSSALAALLDLYRHLEAPTTLAGFGLTDADISQATADILPVVPESNPRPVDSAALRDLLRGALTGALMTHC